MFKPKGGGILFKEEKTFNLRFSLEANFSEDYEGDEDGLAWFQEWETQMKPEIIKQVFQSLRQNIFWKAHIRNRGNSPENEIEIVIQKEFLNPKKI
jgi:hypothetical protein